MEPCQQQLAELTAMSSPAFSIWKMMPCGCTGPQITNHRSGICFPGIQKKLIGVKNLFERLYLFYLRHL